MSESPLSSIEEVLSKLLEPEKVTVTENMVIQKELEEELNNSKIAQSMARFCISIGRQKNGEQGCILAIGVLLPMLVETVNTNTDVAFVNEALESIAKLLTELKGLVFKTEGHLSAVYNCVKNVINKATQCQIKDNGSVDHDEAIMENAGNILYALGFAMTPKEFAPYFTELFPTILQRSKKESSLSEKAFSVGVLATCIKPLNGFLGPFVSELHATLAAFVLEEEINLRTNAIFGIGELVLYGGEHVYQYYPQILQMFIDVTLREDDRYVLDNICGAFARLILTNQSIIPMDTVFPILMKHLPLGEDFVENTTLLKCFVFLLKNKDEQFNLHLVQVLTVLDTMFSNAYLQPEQKVVAGVLAMDIQTKFPHEYQNWVRLKLEKMKLLKE